MNYQETLKYINDTPKFSKILGNDDLLKLLNALDNPQDKLSYIHVAGTNGKGSVCALTAKALEDAGYRTGLFTSPYIEEFNERIRVNGKNIADDELSEIATQVREKIQELSVEISVFAQITAMAFLYFAKEKCDVVVLETGMGGRLDATNVIKTPKAVVITKIGLDHTEWLGDTIGKIAEEKCGIIKKGTSVFTTINQHPEALSVIKEYTEKMEASLYVCQESTISTSLSGDYQKENAGIAEKLCEFLEIDKETIANSFKNTSWIARFEYLRDNLIIDGAHNGDGMEALAKSLKSLNKPVIFVLAMMEDKNIADAIKHIKPLSDKFFITQLDMPRCMKKEELSTYFDAPITADSPEIAVKSALESAKNGEIVCVCGSLYLAGEVRKIFR